jgi:hypothetical protein
VAEVISKIRLACATYKVSTWCEYYIYFIWEANFTFQTILFLYRRLLLLLIRRLNRRNCRVILVRCVNYWSNQLFRHEFHLLILLLNLILVLVRNHFYLDFLQDYRWYIIFPLINYWELILSKLFFLALYVLLIWPWAFFKALAFSYWASALNYFARLLIKL